MANLKRSGDASSRSTDRYFSTSVSNVPADVEDMDALSGAWRKRITPPKSAEEMDMDRIWELRRGIAAQIWKTEKLERQIAYSQKELDELKQSLLYDAEHVDREIIDYGIHIAVDLHKVRKAPELVDRWVKEAAAVREVVEGEGEGKDAAQRSSGTIAAVSSSDKV
jgi:hypothetical protein